MDQLPANTKGCTWTNRSNYGSLFLEVASLVWTIGGQRREGSYPNWFKLRQCWIFITILKICQVRFLTFQIHFSKVASNRASDLIYRGRWEPYNLSLSCEHLIWQNEWSSRLTVEAVNLGAINWVMEIIQNHFHTSPSTGYNLQIVQAWLIGPLFQSNGSLLLKWPNNVRKDFALIAMRNFIATVCKNKLFVLMLVNDKEDVKMWKTKVRIQLSALLFGLSRPLG